MITCDEAGNIVIRINNDAYDLSNSNQYADFLLWATSPVENAIPDEGATPDEDAAPDENEAPGKNSTLRHFGWIAHPCDDVAEPSGR